MTALRKAGFVLPSAIVLLAIMTLALWSAATVLNSLNQDLSQLRAQDEFMIGGLTAEARIAYLIATEPLGPRGLRVHGRRISREEEFGVIREAPDHSATLAQPELTYWFDDRPYRMDLASTYNEGEPLSLVVRIQDQAGLLNFNTGNVEQIRRYSRAMGIGEEQAASLADALADFIDDDDLRRLNGAEERDYRRAERPGPFNERLLSPAQALQAFGWERLRRRQRAALLEGAAADLESMPMNLNTAKPAVLQAWFDLTAAEAELVVAARERAPLIGARNITDLTGKPVVVEELRIYTFPSNRLRISVAPLQDQNLRMETWITIGSLTADRPFFWSPVVVSDNFEGETGAIRGEEGGQFPIVPGLSGSRRYRGGNDVGTSAGPTVP